MQLSGECSLLKDKRKVTTSLNTIQYKSPNSAFCLRIYQIRHYFLCRQLNKPSLSIVKIIASLTPLVSIFVTKVSETLGRADRAQTPALLWRSECGDPPAPPAIHWAVHRKHWINLQSRLHFRLRDIALRYSTSIVLLSDHFISIPFYY